MFELPALLIIDVQRGMSHPAAGARNNAYAEANIMRLLGVWRHASTLIVHVRHFSRSPDFPFWPGQSGAELRPALAPWEDEHVVDKSVPDAFTHSSLERWLPVRDIQRLAIVGVNTNNSVEASEQSAGNLGFDVVVVHDATFTFAKRDHAGVERSADEGSRHVACKPNLSGEYARIRSTDEVLCKVTKNGRAFDGGNLSIRLGGLDLHLEQCLPGRHGGASRITTRKNPTYEETVTLDYRASSVPGIHSRLRVFITGYTDVTD